MKRITVEITSSDEVNITAESIERKWNHNLLEENKIKVKNISSNPSVMKSLAISFSEWVNENYWVRDPFPNKHTEKVMWQRFDDEFKGQSKTAEQLYEMYQKEIGNVS